MKLGILIAVILLLPLAYAVPPFQQNIPTNGLIVETAYPEYHKQSTSLYLHAHVYNASNGILIPTASTSCYSHAYSHSQGSAHILSNITMSAYGVGFNASIPASYFTDSGQYSVIIWCNTSSMGGFLKYTFEVTPSGDGLDEAQASSVYLPMGIVALLTMFFFGLSFMFRGVAGKIVFIGLSAVMIIVAILYTLVIMEQVIPLQDTIIDGLATLWFVIKILIGVAMVFLLVFTLVLVYWSWKEKRGYVRE